jgi:hypothetical protein
MDGWDVGRYPFVYMEFLTEIGDRLPLGFRSTSSPPKQVKYNVPRKAGIPWLIWSAIL